MAKACMEAGCLGLAITGEARCEAHHRPVQGARARAHAARRAGADGDGAARRLRRRLNVAGVGACGVCGTVCSASGLEVDHKIPLANGGTDFDWNVWALCRGCHSQKCANENKQRAMRGRAVAPTVADRRRRW
jgi:5-methylcytosine-specific restriction protein A